MNNKKYIYIIHFLIIKNILINYKLKNLWKYMLKVQNIYQK